MKNRRNVMENMYRLIVVCCVFYSVLVLQIVLAVKNCNFSDAANNDCSDSEMCDEQIGSCECRPGHKRVNDSYCVVPKSTSPNYSSLVDNQGSGSVVAGILIPLFLIIIVVCGVYASKKYKVMNWIRNKMHRRNENYDEFMIGQDDDDPPLA